MQLHITRTQKPLPNGEPGVIFVLWCHLELTDSDHAVLRRYGYPDRLEASQITRWQQLTAPNGLTVESGTLELARAREQSNREFCRKIWDACMDAQSWDGSESVPIE